MKIKFTEKSSKVSGNKNTKKAIANLMLFSEESCSKSKDIEPELAKNLFSFDGKLNKVANVTTVENNSQYLTFLFGIGSNADVKKYHELDYQKIGAKIFNAINANKINSLVIKNNNLISDENLAHIAFGMLLQSYRFNQYFEKRKSEKEISLNEVEIIITEAKKANSCFDDLSLVAQNVFLVRNLVSEPGNVLNPETYAKFCQEIKCKGLEIEVLDEAKMSKLGMNSLLGVGIGSAKKSNLVILRWNGGKKDDAPLAFVGKGVTFDTGGISIKPSANMEDMKTDMAGSAVVVGLLKLLAERKAKVNAVGVIGLVENMPSGEAQRPGDVVKSMSGQTIEIVNTDAEGRLVLADAIYYTINQFKPKILIDLATLTGAIIVCLADIYAGLFSNNKDLAEQLIDSGEKTAEKLWQMPIGSEYDEMINSDIADMKNVGSGRGAGSTTAAQFIKRFISDEDGKEVKWAHLDIAGVAWKGKGDQFATKGATGFGLRLLDRMVRDYYENK